MPAQGVVKIHRPHLFFTLFLFIFTWLMISPVAQAKKIVPRKKIEIISKQSKASTSEPLQSLFFCTPTSGQGLRSSQSVDLLPDIETRYNDKLVLHLHSVYKSSISNHSSEQQVLGLNVSETGLDLELSKQTGNQGIEKMSFNLEDQGKTAMIFFHHGEKSLYQCRNQQAAEIVKNHAPLFSKNSSKVAPKPLPGPLRFALPSQINESRKELLFVHLPENLEKRSQELLAAPSFSSEGNGYELTASDLNSRFISPMQGVSSVLDLAIGKTSKGDLVHVFNNWASPFDLTPDYYEYLSFKAGMYGLDEKYFSKEFYKTGKKIKNEIKKDFLKFSLQLGFLDPNEWGKYKKIARMLNESNYQQGESLRLQYDLHEQTHRESLQKGQDIDERRFLRTTSSYLIDVFDTPPERAWLVQYYLKILCDHSDSDFSQKTLRSLLNGKRSIYSPGPEFEVVSPVNQSNDSISNNTNKNIYLLTIIEFWSNLSAENQENLEENIFTKVTNFPWDIFNELKQSRPLQEEQIQNQLTIKRQGENDILKMLDIDPMSIYSFNDENVVLLAKSMGVPFVIDLMNKATKQRFLRPALENAISEFLQLIEEQDIHFVDQWNEKLQKMELKAEVSDKKSSFSQLQAKWLKNIVYDQIVFKEFPFDAQRLWDDLLEDSRKFHEKEVKNSALKSWKRSDDKLLAIHPNLGVVPWLISAGFRKTLGPLMVEPAQNVGSMINQLSDKYITSKWARLGFAMSIGAVSAGAGLGAPWFAQGLNGATALKLGLGLGFYEAYNATGMAEKVARWSHQFSDTSAGFMGLATNTLLVGTPLLLTRKVSPETLKFLAPRWLAMNTALGAMSTLDHFADYLLEHENGDFVSFVTTMPGSIFGHFGRTSISSAPYMLGLMFVGGRYKAIALGSELADFHEGIFAAMEEFKQTNNHHAFYARSGAVILDLGELGPHQIAQSFIKFKRALMQMNLESNPLLDEMIGNGSQKDFDQTVLPLLFAHIRKDIDHTSSVSVYEQRLKDLGVNQEVIDQLKEMVSEEVDIKKQERVNRVNQEINENKINAMTAYETFQSAITDRNSLQPRPTKKMSASNSEIIKALKLAKTNNWIIEIRHDQSSIGKHYQLDLNISPVLANKRFTPAFFNWFISELTGIEIQLTSHELGTLSTAIQYSKKIGSSNYGKTVVRLMLEEAGFNSEVASLLLESPLFPKPQTELNLVGAPKSISGTQDLDHKGIDSHKRDYAIAAALFIPSSEKFDYYKLFRKAYASGILPTSIKILRIQRFLHQLSTSDTEDYSNFDLTEQQLQGLITVIGMEGNITSMNLATSKSKKQVLVESGFPQFIADLLVKNGFVDHGISSWMKIFANPFTRTKDNIPLLKAIKVTVSSTQGKKYYIFNSISDWMGFISRQTYLEWDLDHSKLESFDLPNHVKTTLIYDTTNSDVAEQMENLRTLIGLNDMLGLVEIKGNKEIDYSYRDRYEVASSNDAFSSVSKSDDLELDLQMFGTDPFRHMEKILMMIHFMQGTFPSETVSLNTILLEKTHDLKAMFPGIQLVKNINLETLDIPLIRWELFPGLTQHQSEIEAARQRYLAKLRVILIDYAHLYDKTQLGDFYLLAVRQFMDETGIKSKLFQLFDVSLNNIHFFPFEDEK